MVESEERFVDIKLPTDAADCYYMNKTKDNIQDFIYIDKDWYEQIFDPNTFYILGPKGSGKTLYAAYMCADIRKDTVSKSHTIDVGDYGKLIAMKTRNHLDFTDYLTMWKVILLQKLLFGIDEKEISFWGRTNRYAQIQATISNYFGSDVTADAFNPVVFIDSNGKQIEVMNYWANQMNVSGKPAADIVSTNELKNQKKTLSSTDNKTERNSLVYTDTWNRSINEFQKTIQKINLKHSHYLFVDGLDVRPKGIDTKEYSECISALVRAVYYLNTKVLGNCKRKDNKDIKVIALTRTDIFLNSGIVNVTSGINDICVNLDWTYPNEKDFKYSNLYKMMNRLLGWDMESKDTPVMKYFNFKLAYPVNRPMTALFYLQRLSRLRPRDIVKMLRIIQAECKKRGLENPDSSVLCSSNFISEYSNYYMNQINAELMFDYTADETKQIFDLISTIGEKNITEERFKSGYEKYCKEYPQFQLLFESHREVLDVCYSVDIIGWSEVVNKHPIFHWHYRDSKVYDETYELPWILIDKAEDVKFRVHVGTGKKLMGHR